MGQAPEYPKRPGHFAHKFCRLVAKSCLANELGTDVCWLLTVIAHTEDAGCYRKAVSFFNGQLAAMCGFSSVDKLERTRKKAIEAGWLHHEPGARGKAACYWVLIPDTSKGLDDLPSDERADKYEVAQPEQSASIDRTGAGESADNLRLVCGQSAAETAASLRNSSSLHLDLHLHQDPLYPPEIQTEDDPTAVGPNPEAVAEVWNQQTGLIPVVGSDVYRDRVIRQWATGNRMWVRYWRRAIEFMGRTPFYCGGEGKWRAELGWLFKASNFTSVVERMLAPPAPPAPAKTKRELEIEQVLAEDAAKRKAG